MPYPTEDQSASSSLKGSLVREAETGLTPTSNGRTPTNCPSCAIYANRHSASHRCPIHRCPIHHYPSLGANYASPNRDASCASYPTTLAEQLPRHYRLD